MADRSEPTFGLTKSVLFSLILIVSFLAMAELLVRGWAYYLREDAEKWDPETETFVLIPGTHRSEQGTATINSQGFAGAELEPDGTDLWRIVALGDSCTYGGGSLTESYPAMLDQLLAERSGEGLRYEVVNAGISGMNSELALRRLRTKVLPLDPEVVIIYIGWNDLMKFDPLAQDTSTKWSGLARALDRLWFVKGMRKLIFYHLRPRLRPPQTGPASDTRRLEDFQPTFYEENLRSMIADVRAAGGRPVLTTLPTVVRADMTLQELRDAGVVFPYFSSAYGVGDFLDVIDAYNRSIEQVGARQGVPVIDLAERFRVLEDPSAYFWDTMHTNLQGRMLIAETLLKGLEREGLLGRGGTSGRAEREHPGSGRASTATGPGEPG